MTDEETREEDETGKTEEEKKAPTRRRRRATTAAAPKRTSRFERRAEKATTTLRKLIHLRRPDLDIGDKTFVEIVERDADAWGKLLAQVGEWFVPFGQLIDIAFGAPLLVLLDIAPSIRAARRDLATRRDRKREIAAEEEARLREEQGLRQEWEAQP